MNKAYSRRMFRDSFAQNNLYCEDSYGHHRAYIDVEKPYEELNPYQKKLILFICRQFAPDGRDKLCEELDKPQYCSLETALRVAREGGYEPQKEETTMPKAIMTEEQIIEMIGLYNGGMKPAKLAERYELDSGQVRNLLNKAKRNDKYKHLFTDKTEKTTEEQDKRFEEILDSIDAGAKKPETVENQPECVAECPKNDIDRAAEAIENYLEEKRLTGDMTETEAMQEKAAASGTFTATGEGLIEAVDGMLLIEGQDIVKEISEQLAENFLGSFYGSVTVHFEVLPERKVLRFNVG